MGKIPETYSDLEKVIDILEKQHETDLITSVKTAQKLLLSLELMAMAAGGLK